ncbi:hypothetical protein [Rhizobium mesoamericanum]|uniref:hypothetical protein n=1 Tax=Rhizobium mesoamericanum TaxID=1079800 RepID=UPI00048BE348|nr:hypothetical protein [Rhizobium mesoamericanum]
MREIGNNAGSAPQIGRHCTKYAEEPNLDGTRTCLIQIVILQQMHKQRKKERKKGYKAIYPAKPSQAKPSQAKPSQAKPSQAKPSQAKRKIAIMLSLSVAGFIPLKDS